MLKALLVLKTLYTQPMLERGILASTAFYASYAHKEDHIEKYYNATDQVFAIFAAAIREGNPEKLLKGSVSHSGFKRLT